MKKGITILGATGSIGISTLDVIKQHPHEFNVIALTANKQVKRMQELCIEWSPLYAVMADSDAATQLEQSLKQTGSSVKVLSGVAGLNLVASLSEVDMVMAAIVGSAGLLPTLAAVKTGKRILLANKEALVMSGKLFTDAVRQYGAKLLPIDSEHNAIFQCLFFDEAALPSKTPENLGINRILLTASGGPFRTYSIEQLHEVTPQQACAHPNWDMGQKISVDSATMMNKGLEVIEAHWLFSIPAKQIEVLLHPQSIIHSLVEYIDGSVLAQLGNPDMRTPIAHALLWPKRIKSGVPYLDLIKTAQLNFEAINFNRFPCLKLAYEALNSEGTATTILNAANEIAVEAFLQKTISFTSIPKVIETTLSQLNGRAASSIEIILEDDKQARELAQQIVNNS
ncbi:MAG: 1-deoxy-D-xylulose-5-phosphate reductoisomerase [Thiomargarita sp.]|nr:1-deoxy-D-xylulose-5-phosphate reductoisomerase [Thiomargarita sp.]